MNGKEPAPVPSPLPPQRRDPWSSLAGAMFRIGFNSFGGPVAQIGFMHREAVERRGWLTGEQFLHLVSFANVLPGPEALEVAIHLGYLRRGRLGAIVAGLLFVWPGFVALTALGWIYVTFGKLDAVEAFLDGVRPVAAALLAFAAFRFAKRAVRGAGAAALTAAAFGASFLLQAPFLPLLLGCGILGAALAPRGPESLGHRGRAVVLTLLAAALASGLILRPAPPPASADSPAVAEAAQTRPSPRADPGRLAAIAWVNTKAAMVTFGGAYTVLPYLRQLMVVEEHWVTDREMVDALALGETTPGPLISIGVFLSYLAGGLPGALVGGFFLFLPSFVLVLSLAPHLERIAASQIARRFLWGVSAGTLGLILSLAAALLPHGIPDAFSASIAAIALFALWRLDANALIAVLAGGLAGLARHWIA